MKKNTLYFIEVKIKSGCEKFLWTETYFDAETILKDLPPENYRIQKYEATK